jgi:hypothetical protein
MSLVILDRDEAFVFETKEVYLAGCFLTSRQMKKIRDFKRGAVFWTRTCPSLSLSLSLSLSVRNREKGKERERGLESFV